MKYELGENGKPVPTKEQIISMVECGRSGLATRPAALVAFAVHIRRPDEPRPDVSWARKVIDYPAAERVFDKMVADGLLVGRVAHEWARLGISTYLQGRTKYYATASTARHIEANCTEEAAEKYRQRVRLVAAEKLIAKHPEEFEALVKETEEDLPPDTS